MAESAQLTRLLSNATLARLERMRLVPWRTFTERSRGESLSGRGGRSIEFADYRDYVSGDDIRYVDWNVFSRLGRPYIKLFAQEEQIRVNVLVDGSSSMGFEGKFERACALGAGFGVMGLFNNQPVTVTVFGADSGAPARVGPMTGRARLARMMRFFEGLETGGTATLGAGVEAMLQSHRGKGVVVVLSDFLTEEDLSPAMTRLVSCGLEILGVQILGPTEIDPEVNDDLRLIDSEAQRDLDVSASDALLGAYQRYREAYERQIERMCVQRGGRYLRVSSQVPIEHILFNELVRRGWVR